MATAQSISMLSHVLQFIIFKVLANRDYYKLFTVCEWNNLHVLKHSLPIQSLAHLLSPLRIMKDYWDGRLSPGFTMLLRKLGSGCCLSLCWEPGFVPGVLSSMPMGLRARTCGLRPAQAHPAPALG